MESTYMSKLPDAVNKLTQDAAAALDALSSATAPNRHIAVAQITALLKSRAAAMKDLLAHLQETAQKACMNPDQPFASEQACCSFLDGIGAILVPEELLSTHKQLQIGCDAHMGMLSSITTELVAKIKRPEDTLLAKVECVKHWARLLTSSDKVMISCGQVARNLVQLMLPVLLLPEVQEALQGTGVVASLVKSMKYRAQYERQHEVVLQALTNLTSCNNTLQRELKDSPDFLSIVAASVDHNWNPPPTEEIKTMALLLVLSIIGPKTYTEQLANPVFGEEDARVLQAWASTVEQSMSQVSDRSQASETARLIDTMYGAAVVLQLARRGLVAHLRKRILHLRSAASTPGFKVSIGTNQAEDQVHLAICGYLTGGLAGGCRRNFISRSHLQQLFYHVRLEVDEDFQWLPVLYAKWVMGPVYDQLVQASSKEAKQNTGLQRWEQQLAKLLVFSDSGVLLRFTTVVAPDISNGDVTAWVKKLVQLDMAKVASNSYSAAAGMTVQPIAGDPALSLNVDRRLLRLLVFVELAFNSAGLGDAVLIPPNAADALDTLIASIKRVIENEGDDCQGAASAATAQAASSRMLSGSVDGNNSTNSTNAGSSNHSSAAELAPSSDQEFAPPAEICAACEQPAGDGRQLKSCAACLVTMYCSRACQNQHWKEH